MFLLIDNYDSFTFNLVQAFAGLGNTPVVVKNDDPALLSFADRDDLDMVCISPGPGRPETAGACMDFLRRLPHTIPVLGVCLGHQILGCHAGAAVEVAGRVMHGKQSVIDHDGKGIFSGIASPMTVGRYHSLLVKAELAKDLLEVTAACTAPDGTREVMAMRFRDRPWVGVQFHPESVLTPEGVRLLANFPATLLHEGVSPAATPDASASPRTGAKTQMAEVIELLAQGQDLDRETASEVFSRLMDGELTPSQAGAFLLGLRAKGETPEEVGEAVNAILNRAVAVPALSGECIDIVGTGGDNKFSFNCSTATSLTLAGMGYRVLKHGNRSVSSRCGSADVLERLGIDLDTPPEEVPHKLEAEKFVFLFAPKYHPSFKNVMPLRRELGIRTLFNILGPLVNPAKPTRHFLGVPGRAQLSLVAETLARTSEGSGAVVLGAGGYDELTTMGEAEIVFVENGQTRAGKINPEDYGFPPCSEKDLAVTSPEEAADVLRALLSGQGPQAMRDMLALNLGFAIYLMETDTGKTEPTDPVRGFNIQRMHSAMNRAKEAVATGSGRRFAHA